MNSQNNPHFGDILFYGIISLIVCLTIILVGLAISSKNENMSIEPEREFIKKCVSFNVKSTEETKNVIAENSLITFSACGETLLNKGLIHASK